MTHDPARSEEEAFDAFDRANPELWAMFERLTLNRISKGARHYSARAVLHAIRWESGIGDDGLCKLKINNNTSCWYARKFHRTHPVHANFFRERMVKRRPPRPSMDREAA
jgi:hypothetical protein